LQGETVEGKECFGAGTEIGSSNYARIQKGWLNKGADKGGRGGGESSPEAASSGGDASLRLLALGKKGKPTLASWKGTSIEKGIFFGFRGEREETRVKKKG